ncbi:MAG: TRAP transporter TatT component family protein [Candidatus Bipolaricaulota bacterium]|nr:TRAP transporter TatT component family protein [Candidatus Bipolaricaulota bacterium]MCX7844022.1 TRAP transporter TatT component family protein [Candidatus Bipolaricaulota bacterium]MDW8151992.1 TRAP transporter TatT component family protein [Candidatus Bipolaricaulota bacterium]
MRRLLGWIVVFAVVGGATPAECFRQAEALYPQRYQLPVLERILALYEEALRLAPRDPEVLIRLAQHWYEWGVLVPEEREEEGWRKAAEYAFQALGLSGLDEALRLSNEEFREFLARCTEGRALLWAGHGWGQLLGRMNPFSAFFALPKIRAIYERAMELAPTYMAGSAFQAYGALLANLSDYGILFGVKLAQAKPYFEKALEIDPTYLDHYVAYAKEYAVRAKDRALFESLLRQVLEAPIGNWPFWNEVAKDRAARFLAEIERYFK